MTLATAPLSYKASVTASVRTLPKCAPNPLEIRARIDALESAMFASPAQIAIETTHYFADGLYAREIFIPAGTLLTGKIHTREHINIISQGEIEVVTENGARLVKAPATFVSPPGTKRVGLAKSDTVWTTIHANEDGLTDPDEMEAVLIAPSHVDLLQ